MNILIYGPAATGKTLLAELLQEYYEREGQPTAILDDSHQAPAAMTENTWASPFAHTIVVTQNTPDTGDPFKLLPLWDYYYHCAKATRLRRIKA